MTAPAHDVNLCNTGCRDGALRVLRVLSAVTRRRLPDPSTLELPMSLPVATPVVARVPLRKLTVSSPSSGPTRLRVPDLLHVTDQAADDVLSGRCDHLLPAGGVPESRRWFTRIHGDDELDIWLISWVPGHPTELHDHGGSLGALTVLSGSLNEFRWDGMSLRQRRLDPGDQAGFPLGWVHDVVWAPGPLSPPALSRPAPPTLSVHAYSPPLTAMSYYEVTDRNALRRRHTELTDQPEGSR